MSTIFGRADVIRLATSLAHWQDLNSGQVPPPSSINRLCADLRFDPSAEQLAEAWREAPKYRRPSVTERLNITTPWDDLDEEFCEANRLRNAS